MSKTGPSRIPTFGSRIPQPSQYSKPKPISSTPTSSPLSEVVLGCKVHLAGKEGILRYIGNVHFAPGIWCGIELTSSTGTHDGYVKGVRYFCCPPNRGQMAPFSKVVLENNSLEDVASGPFSILFIENNSKRGVKDDSDDEEDRFANSLKKLKGIQTFLDQKQFCVEPNHKTKNGTIEDSVNTSSKVRDNFFPVAFSAAFKSNQDISDCLIQSATEFTNPTIIYSSNVDSCLNEKEIVESTLNNELLKKTKFQSCPQKNPKEKINIADNKPTNTENNQSLNNISSKFSETIRANEKLGDLNFANSNQSANITLSKNLIVAITNKSNDFEKIVNTSQSSSITNSTSTLIGTTSEKHDVPSNIIGTNSKSDQDIRFSSAQSFIISNKKFSSLNINSEFNEDESNKRDSLDFDESLGILTPDQIIEDMNFFTNKISNTDYIRIKLEEASEREVKLKPSTLSVIENSNKNDNIIKDTEQILHEFELKSELPSPSNVTDYSFGIIDEQLLSNLTLKTDTTVNMELPLDTADKCNEYNLNRLEQTPSPEDLPLDPMPIIESNNSKAATVKVNKTTNSFITSITSITSLDTGYQGDGEMSRPASRGADNSPLTRRPVPRPQPRRQDPMTDSDFYTESDADNHEENPLRGDRRAQVIDGTLYGVDPQAAADIYVNNRENMDSSGIFTDLEMNNTRADDIVLPPPNIDISPSDTSSKTISENSQDNVVDIVKKCVTEESEKKDNPKKRNAPSPSTVASSPSSVLSPRHVSKDESPLKKYKLPKKEVTSKVKAMIEPNANNKGSSLKKPTSRWDAVMNKISKTDMKTNLKDVKSKVYNITPSSSQRQIDRKLIPRQTTSEKSTISKTRRIRQRVITSPKSQSNIGSSVHSSLSDLSGSHAQAQQKKIPVPSKKRDSVQVTQVLTNSKLPPRTNSQQSVVENKKPPAAVESKSNKRAVFPAKEKKVQLSIAAKENNKNNVKGGRNSPIIRPPTVPRVAAKNVPRVAEALAVLVQHLVFNVEAYQVPSLKKDLQKCRLEAEDMKLSLHQLEETLTNERIKNAEILEAERAHFQKKISDVAESYRAQITKLNSQLLELEEHYIEENQASKQQLKKLYDEQLSTFENEFKKLQKTHEESLDILREENDAIREQIDEKNEALQQYKCELTKFKETCLVEEQKLKKENQKMKHELRDLEKKLEDRFKNVKEENFRLREDNERLLNYGDDSKGISVQEVESLRAVLELKQDEVADLRRALAEASQKAEMLTGASEKAAVLNARCEDLELQLQRKTEYEQSLLSENRKLQESFKEEFNQRRRLSQYNEELQWKLKQNREVISKVIEQAEESVFNRSSISSSFNERHTVTQKNFERTLSFRDRLSSSRSCSSNQDGSRCKKSKASSEIDLIDLSPPVSPKVKGVVEKSDSVSYVLDLDDDPGIVASRIVRRSFRNTTSPKNTPSKSGTSKRARMKNPLSLSASANSIVTPNKLEYQRSRSVSVRSDTVDNETNNGNEVFLWSSTPCRIGDKLDALCQSSCSSIKLDDNIDFDDDNDVDIKLPALPSEIGRQNRGQALPSPKHLAGEAMISESNSEDESTSSSSVQL